MRKQGLPLQRLLSGDALTTLARDLHYAGRRRAVRGGRREPGLAPVGRAEAGRRARRRRGRGRGHRRDRRPDPAGPRRRPAGDPGVVVKGASDVWVKLARCCTPVPGDAILGFVTRAGGVSRAPHDCTNAEVAAGRAGAGRRGRVGAVDRLGVPGRDPGRGARPAPAARRRHPGALRRAGRTSCPRRSPPPATGWRSAGSPSRWPTRSTWATCWPVRKVDGVFDATASPLKAPLQGPAWPRPGVPPKLAKGGGRVLQRWGSGVLCQPLHQLLC